MLVCSYKSNCCSWVCWMFVASSVIKTLWMQIKFRCSVYCNRTTPLTCDPFGKHAGGQPAFSTVSGSRSMPSVEHFWEFFLPWPPGDSAAQGWLLLHQQPTGAVAHHPPFHLLQEAYAVLALLMSCYQVFPVSPCSGAKTAGLKTWMFFLSGGLRFRLKFNRNCPNNMTSEASSTQDHVGHEIYFYWCGNVTADSHAGRVALFWGCHIAFTHSWFSAGVSQTVPNICITPWIPYIKVLQRLSQAE